MKTKECPSCAMDIDDGAQQCPICQYEFPVVKKTRIWLAFVLAILLLLLFLL